jgi:hypothetical protein
MMAKLPYHTSGHLPDDTADTPYASSTAMFATAIQIFQRWREASIQVVIVAQYLPDAVT